MDNDYKIIMEKDIMPFTLCHLTLFYLLIGMTIHALASNLSLSHTCYEQKVP